MFCIFKTLLKLNFNRITIILLFCRYHIIQYVSLLCFVKLPTAKSLVISVAISESSTTIFNQRYTNHSNSKNTK